MMISLFMDIDMMHRKLPDLSPSTFPLPSFMFLIHSRSQTQKKGEGMSMEKDQATCGASYQYP
jgi:hypothetical protein